MTTSREGSSSKGFPPLRSDKTSYLLDLLWLAPVLFLGYALIAEEKIAEEPVRGEIIGDAKTFAGRGSAPRKMVRLVNGDLVKVTGGGRPGAVVCVLQKRGGITGLPTAQLTDRSECGLEPPEPSIKPLPVPQI